MHRFHPSAHHRLLIAGLALSMAGAALGQAMPGMNMPAAPTPMPGPTPGPTPRSPTAIAQPAPPADRTSRAGGMAGMTMTQSDGLAMRSPAAFGPYAMTREASGTAWQPDASTMQGAVRMAGDWTFMGQAMLNAVYDHQSGRRGDDRLFASGMVMGMATGTLSSRDTVALRAMLSPDPFMGRSGYPLMLAAGETADGRTSLIDRQHPHDLFMELSGSYSRRVGEDASAFVYVGFPGEPAFGPGSFMHRLSIMDSPEAPITHHWFDSTHITFGVVTAGLTRDGVKIEVSRFKGREPDQHRYDIETPRFDSTAIRASWNPTATLALQASWMRLVSPEQLTPEEDQERWSASAIYTRAIGAGGYVAATAAWGRKTEIEPDGHRGHGLDAYLLEATARPDDRWTVFARVERIDTDELLPAPGQVHGPEFTVGKASLGAIRDFRISRGVKLGVGGLVARSLTPGGLDPAYRGDRTSGMAFVRVKVG